MVDMHKKYVKAHIKMDSRNVIIFQNFEHSHPPAGDCEPTIHEDLQRHTHG